jgi:hypothetical protein
MITFYGFTRDAIARVRDYSAGRRAAFESGRRTCGVRIWRFDGVLDKYGKSGWAVDPEGNRFELWQPPSGA